MTILMRTLGILLALVVGLALTACANEEKVREQLLKKTPLGSDMAQVLRFCAQENLQCKSSERTGYLNQHTGQTIGVKSVWGAVYKRRTTPLTITSVEAYWGFDKDGRLIDIWAWKTIDAP